MTDPMCRPEGAEPLDSDGLPGILRVLLATNGTVTEVLEAWFREPVVVADVAMETTGDGPASRQVVLTGRSSGRRFAAAASALDLERLPDAMKEQLALSPRGIGQAIETLRLPTFRTIEDRWRQPAAAFAETLCCAPADPLVARRYTIAVGTRPAIRIVERFPLAVYAEG